MVLEWITGLVLFGPAIIFLLWRIRLNAEAIGYERGYQQRLSDERFEAEMTDFKCASLDEVERIHAEYRPPPCR